MTGQNESPHAEHVADGMIDTLKTMERNFRNGRVIDDFSPQEIKRFDAVAEEFDHLPKKEQKIALDLYEKKAERIKIDLPTPPKEQRTSYETLKSGNRLTVGPSQKTEIDAANSLRNRRAEPTNRPASPVPGHFNDM